MSFIHLFLAVPAAIALIIPLLFPLRWLPLYLIPAGSWLAYNFWRAQYNPMAFDGPAGWLAVALIGTLVTATAISIISILSAEALKRLTGKTQLIYIPTRIIFLLFFIGIYAMHVGVRQNIKSANNSEPTVACLQSITPVLVGNELLNVPIHPGFAFFDKHAVIYSHGSPRRINEFCQAASSYFSKNIEIQSLIIITKELSPHDTWSMPNCSAPGRFSWMDKLCSPEAKDYRNTIPKHISLTTEYKISTNRILYEQAHEGTSPIINIGDANEENLGKTNRYRLASGDIIGLHCRRNGQHCSAAYMATDKLYVSFSIELPEEGASIANAMSKVEVYYPNVREIVDTLIAD